MERQRSPCVMSPTEFAPNASGCSPTASEITDDLRVGPTLKNAAAAFLRGVVTPGPAASCDTFQAGPREKSGLMNAYKSGRSSFHSALRLPPLIARVRL